MTTLTARPAPLTTPRHLTTPRPLTAPRPLTTPRRALRVAGLLWSESRPVVQLVVSLRLLAGATLALAGRDVVVPGAAGRFVHGAACWLLLTVGIYLWNAHTDRHADATNHKGRPLSDGLLAPAVVRRAATVSTGAGLVLAMPLPLVVRVCGVLYALAGWLYSSGPRPAKQTAWGASLVTTSAGALTFVAGAATVGAAPTPTMVVFAACLALWMGVAGSTKDFADVVGDARAGRRTLPVVLGPARARHVVALASLALGAAAGGAAVCDPLLLGLVAMPVGACVLLVHAVRPGRPRAPYRAFVVTQYVTLVWTLVGTSL